MTAGNDPGEGTGKNTGPHPITAPFDWGLGSASVPAQPLPAEPTELIPAPIGLPAPTELRSDPYFTSDPEEDVDPASPIDALFGETQFKDYEGEPMVGPIPTELNPFAGAAAGVEVAGAAAAGAGDFGGGAFAPPVVDPVAQPAPDRAPRAPLAKNQKMLFWVAGGAIALLVLAVLFALGTKIPRAPTPVAVVSKSASPSPSARPASTVAPTGPVAAGEHQWGDLRGGECVDPYTNPFAQTFTVVDCAAPHPAQMVARGTFPGESTAVYPGLESLQSQVTLLCTAPGVIDLSTAGAYNDIQFQASYAATMDEWTTGQHDYFCFVNRASGEPITGSVAGIPAK